MTTETLEALARKAAEGDREALDAFVRRIQDDVYRLCLRMLADPVDAEDAAQEVLVKVVTHLSGFRGESASVRGCGGSPPTTCSRFGALAASRA